MAAFACRATARISLTIHDDGPQVMSSARAAALVREMIRSGIEEHFSDPDEVEVVVESLEAEREA